MVIAPLVFSTLTVGIMRLGETATIGRVGGKAMVWFITSSVLSILVGLVIVTFQHPGAGLNRRCRKRRWIPAWRSAA
nr:Aerobic C4-dicarboxylate transport protein [Klebsiella pneumoniae]